VRVLNLQLHNTYQHTDFATNMLKERDNAYAAKAKVGYKSTKSFPLFGD